MAQESSPEVSPQKNSAFQVLREVPAFRLLISCQIVSQLGDALTELALMWLVLELTGSALKMGAVMIAYMLPVIFFALPAGAMVDRPLSLAMSGFLADRVPLRLLYVAMAAIFLASGVVGLRVREFKAFDARAELDARAEHGRAAEGNGKTVAATPLV